MGALPSLCFTHTGASTKSWTADVDCTVVGMYKSVNTNTVLVSIQPGLTSAGLTFGPLYRSVIAFMNSNTGTTNQTFMPCAFPIDVGNVISVDATAAGIVVLLIEERVVS